VARDVRRDLYVDLLSRPVEADMKAPGKVVPRCLNARFVEMIVERCS